MRGFIPEQLFSHSNISCFMTCTHLTSSQVYFFRISLEVTTNHESCIFFFTASLYTQARISI